MKGRLWLPLVFALLFGPVRTAAAAPLGLPDLQMQEKELRLLLARRNLERAAAEVRRAQESGFADEALRIQRRFRALARPYEDAARRDRLAAIVRLERFAAASTQPVHGADALLRLASLYMEVEDERYGAAMAQALGRDPEEDEGAIPRRDYADARRVLQELLSRYPDSGHRALARYLIGYCFLEEGHESAAAATFTQLLEEDPGIPFRSELLVRVGDYHFEAGRLERAETYYAEATGGDDVWMDRALYKRAWTLYRMDRYAEAVSAFTRLADMGRSRPDLLEESLQYLAISYVEGFGYAAAVTHMAERGPRDFDQRLRRRVADVLFDSTRFPEAISAYTAAMARIPLGPERLELAQRVLAALHQERRLDEAVAMRRAFVEDFATGSTWYAAQATRPALQAQADRLAERFLFEFATYHHYRKLRGVAESEPMAEAAYRDYLARYAGKPRAVPMAFYLAEILYDRGEFASAIGLYETVALSAPDPATDIAARAAYNMVLSARELAGGKAADGPDRLLEVSRKFADLRPTDERSPLVLYHAARRLCDAGRGAPCREELKALIDRYPDADLVLDAVQTVIDSYAADKRYGELAAWADRILRGRHMAVAAEAAHIREIVGAAMFHEALARERGGEVEPAVRNYLGVYARYGATRSGTTALFNAGHLREKEKRYAEALAIYEKLLARHPKAESAPRAAFRRAWIYEQVLDLPRAIDAYGFLLARFPRAREAVEARFNRATLLAGVERHAEAAAEFEAHYQLYGVDATATSDALLRAAAQWEAAGELERARQRYEEFARMRLTPRAPFALWKAAQISEGKVRAKLLDRGLALCAAVAKAGLSPEDGVLAALRFDRAEADRKAYFDLELPTRLERAAAVLERKAALLKRLESAYAGVVAAGDTYYALAAMYRIGELYQHFADMLFAAPVPAGLAEDEAEIYRAELADQAAPLEDKALQAFRKAMAKAERDSLENEWTARIREALDRRPVRIRILTADLTPPVVTADRDTPPILLRAATPSQAPRPPISHSGEPQTVGDWQLERLLIGAGLAERLYFGEGRTWVHRFPAAKEVVR